MSAKRARFGLRAVVCENLLLNKNFFLWGQLDYEVQLKHKFYLFIKFHY